MIDKIFDRERIKSGRKAALWEDNMVSLIDTHCHITCDALFERIEEVLANAKEHHVERMMIVCTDFKEFERAELLKQKDDRFDIALGFHPCDLKDVTEADYERLEQLLREDRICALGEIGMDYHWDDVAKEDQKNGFRRQIALAKRYDKPILIHMREATKDTLEILRESAPHKGIFHCFSGSLETARIVLDMGFHIAYGGPLTFKNSKEAPQVCAQLPKERLFVETDCPYLTPHPYRGKQNEPMYVGITFDKVCELQGVEQEIMAEQMRKSYEQLFGRR